MSSVELGGFALRWASRTDVGKVRMINEDSTLAVPGMFVVADGMGGHAAGDIASSLTIESFRAASESMPMPITQLSIVLSAANESVITYARDNDRDGMGTTVVGAAVVDNGGDPAIVVFHVGDSRCYLVGTDRLVRLTNSTPRSCEPQTSGFCFCFRHSVTRFEEFSQRARGLLRRNTS